MSPRTEQKLASTTNQAAASETTGSADVQLLTDKERARVLSTFRLKVLLTTFVVILLLGLSTLVFVLVSRIFDQVTPATARDLRWKAERGAVELAHTADLGIVIRDAEQIRSDVKSFAHSDDVSAVVVTDADGKVLLREGVSPHAGGNLFDGHPSAVRETEDAYTSWVPVTIEGAQVGRVGVVVSKARLDAGNALRKSILGAGAAGTLLALLACLLFVNLYIGPLIRVTASAFKNLEKKTREAMEATRLKSEFLANMSHEIRTPMNGVIGMTQLLRGTTLDEKQARYAHTIESSAAALLTIINDILDFSKIEAGKLTLRNSDCNVGALVEEVAQMLSPAAHAKGVEIVCHLESDVPEWVQCDSDRLRQIVSNIAGNAVKFTESGHVKLHASVARRQGDDVTLEISVEDTGIGIPQVDQARIFENFSQVDGSLTRRFGGTGLGLAISQSLVRMMGGVISVESELGKGSLFTFTLKATVVQGMPNHSQPLDHLPRTLVVDDNATNLAVLETMLRSWGVPVVTAESVGSAQHLVQAALDRGEPFELALLDHQMPEMTGLGLAEWIRTKCSPSPTIVIATSLGRGGEIPDSELCLTKPLRQADVRHMVQKARGGGRSPLSAPAPTARPSSERHFAFAGHPHVLVVEDNPVNQLVMRAMLDELGITCDVASDGQQGLDAIAKRVYPLILMDCQMPVLDGYQATQRLRALPDERADIPVIAVTAHAFEGERERIREAGIDGYLTKPVTLRALADTIAAYLPPAPSPSTAPPPDEEAPVPADVSSAAPASAGIPFSAGSDGSPLSSEVKRSKAVMQLFLKLAPGQLEEVRKSVTLGNATDVKAHAHKLKGSCYAIGAQDMAKLCAELEPHPPESSRLLSLLGDEMVRVRGALQLELGTPPS